MRKFSLLETIKAKAYKNCGKAIDLVLFFGKFDEDNGVKCFEPFEKDVIADSEATIMTNAEDSRKSIWFDFAKSINHETVAAFERKGAGRKASTPKNMPKSNAILDEIEFPMATVIKPGDSQSIEADESNVSILVNKFEEKKKKK
uniref:Uncharacterized protein n=1 Tax=Panagrolaimus sp. JU765 TaxID=591449 RepID=A0AC34QSM0_9BILA